MTKALRFAAPVLATAVGLGVLTAVPASAADGPKPVTGPKPATAIETGLAPEAPAAKPWLSIRIFEFRLLIGSARPAYRWLELG